MKQILVLSVLLFSFSALAKDIRLSCTVTHNLNVVHQAEILVKENAKNVSIGSFELFEMFVSSLPDGRYELQMLNSMEPSRAYATGNLNTQSPVLELSVWTREFLIETKCKLID